MKRANPLVQGYSRKAIAENVKRLRRDGLPQNQAVAGALRTARQAWRRAHPRGRFPEHLRAPARSNPTARGMTFEDAARRFSDFTDEDALAVDTFELDIARKQYAWLLGPMVEVAYEIPRFEGERRIVAVHKFKRDARPFLAATPDQLFIVGGSYEVTDHGIEDR